MARAVAEMVGSIFLLAGVVGSGIMASRLSDDVGIQLLANSAATAGVLGALITSLGPVSGAHLNPAVSLVAAARREITLNVLGVYATAQTVGAIGGVVLANLMFDLAPISWSTTERAGNGILLAEVVATLGLLLVIWGSVAAGRADQVAWVVAGYIGGAYWFTASTSFANPAVTIARTFSDTFAGIDPASAPAFVLAQLLAVGVAIPLIALLFDLGGDAPSDGTG